MISKDTLLRIAAAEAHFAIAFALVLGVVMKVPVESWRIAIVAGFLVIAAVKETIWDPRNEIDQPFIWEGAEDLFFYVIGAIGGLLFALF